MLQMPLETTWQIEGVWGMPWRWKGLSCFPCGWGEWLAPKPKWKTFLFINSSLAIKMNVNHECLSNSVLWKCWICLHFRQASARQLFLLKPVGEIAFHFSSSFTWALWVLQESTSSPCSAFLQQAVTGGTSQGATSELWGTQSWLLPASWIHFIFSPNSIP